MQVFSELPVEAAAAHKQCAAGDFGEGGDFTVGPDRHLGQALDRRYQCRAAGGDEDVLGGQGAAVDFGGARASEPGR